MENFQYIDLPNTPENLVFIEKGFEFMSNQFFESIGQGLLIAYLFQSLSLSEYQYGLQLFRSLSMFSVPNRYTNLESSFLNPKNTFDLTQNLSNLFNPHILSELKELGEDLLDESSFLTLQASLRELSKKLNMQIIVFYKQETIEFNYFPLPRPITIGISLDIRSKYTIYSTQQQVSIDTEPKQLYIEQLIKVSCDILEKHNTQVFFGHELNSLLSAVHSEVQQSVLRLPKKTQIINFSSAPVLRNTDFSAMGKNKMMKPSYELPHTLEKTTHFLNEFVSEHPRKFAVIMLDNGKYLEDSSSDISKKSLLSRSESDISLNIPTTCAICRQESVKVSMINHPCSLCQNCSYESFLTKSCQSCSHIYTDSELETLDPYFN